MTDLEKQAETSVDHVLIDFKQRFKDKGIKQKDLAKQLNVSVATLWRIFNHKTPLSLYLFIKMCIILELKVNIVEG